MPINVAIVEDHLETSNTLNSFLGNSMNVEIIAVCDSVEQFLNLNLYKNQLEILLLDIGLPGMTGLEGIQLIKQKFPGIKIIMFTSFDDSERIFKALCAGATSYISKRTSLDKIKEAIYVVHRGGAFMSPEIARKVVEHFQPKKVQTKEKLTERENDVVTGLVDGLSYKKIAQKYEISLETVREYIKRIYRKLEVNNKAQAIQKVLTGDY